MASGRVHPKQQLVKARRGTKSVNETANVAEVIAPRKQAKQAPVVHRNSPDGLHEQASITVVGDIVGSARSTLPTAKSRGKNGAGPQSEPGSRAARFNVSLQAKLAKQTEFSVCVFSPDRNRGQIVIESIHVGIYRKGESLFDGDVPVGKESKVSPGTRKCLSFSDAQKKQLSRVLKSKTFASISAVYTAPAQTEVTLSIANDDSKKKKSNS
jgi:hypothetical protein